MHVRKRLDFEIELTQSSSRITRCHFAFCAATNYDLLLQGPTPFNPARPFRSVLRPDSRSATQRSIEEIFDIMDAPFAVHIDEAGSTKEAGSDGGESKPPAEEASSGEGEATESGSEIVHNAAREAFGLPEFRVPIIQVHGSVAEEVRSIACLPSLAVKLMVHRRPFSLYMCTLS